GGHRIIPVTRRVHSEIHHMQFSLRRVLSETQRIISKIEDKDSAARHWLSAIGQGLSISQGMRSMSHHRQCRRRCKVDDVHDRVSKTHGMKSNLTSTYGGRRVGFSPPSRHDRC
ncbi:MAG: hypothetical protein ABI411_21470, partial [Tahibacter sp.]